MRGLNEKHAREKGRLDWKRRQIFFQLLSNLRLSNPALLSWWALIQSFANFGWGIGATASDVESYWGHTGSNSTRKRRIAGLTNNLIWKYRRLLRKSRARLFAFDNYQIGQEIKDQRGSHSSTFFKGTNECAHRVNEYDESEATSCKIHITKGNGNGGRIFERPGVGER